MTANEPSDECAEGWGAAFPVKPEAGEHAFVGHEVRVPESRLAGARARTRGLTRVDEKDEVGGIDAVVDAAWRNCGSLVKAPPPTPPGCCRRNG